MHKTLYNADGSRTDLRINAKVRRAHAFSRGSGPLSERRPMTEEENVVAEKQRARRDFAAMTSAPAKVAPQPDKPKGQLVQGPGGSAVWRTNEQLAKEAEARAAVRKRAGGTTAGANGMFGDMMRVVKKGFDAANQLRKTQDRNYARSRVASEKNDQGRVMSGEDAANYREYFRRKGMLNESDPEVERDLNS